MSTVLIFSAGPENLGFAQGQLEKQENQIHKDQYLAKL